MFEVDTVVVGAGQAGLAVSRLLTGAGHEHVVLEQGRVGERWRSARWDSLHLITPSWMTRLPGHRYQGPDPDGYLSASAFADLLDRYAASFDAPVLGSVAVREVSAAPDGGSHHRYRVVTDTGTWRARQVVIATGPHGTPRIPAAMRAGDVDGVEVVTAQRYRNPAQLPPGGVLVVGASASGVQIADELARAGRSVVLAVGRHNRLPRRYRGMDIFWWLESTGRLARTVDDVRDVAAARGEPSLQLVGRAHDLDLGVLQSHGVRLAGHLQRMTDGRAWFRNDLAGSVTAAERAMHRVLDAADEYAARAGLDTEIAPPRRPGTIRLPRSPLRRLDLSAEGIGTVLLATGYRPRYPWLRLPITAPDGSIEQYRGVTSAPGVYTVGQRFQHRRDSAFIDGARHDAATVVHHLLAQAGMRATAGCLAGEGPAA